MDPSLNELLKWGIQNSTASTDAPADPNAPPADPRSTDTQPFNSRALDPALLQQLLGGPSDADRMKDAMSAIQNPEVDLENKLIAFDNFEQLVEGIDNANNLEALKLWVPLVEQLTNTEAEMRMYAAWCIGTSVQNNVKAQETLNSLGAIPILIKLATSDPSQPTRKKSILALSSAIRNYQPNLDVALKYLSGEHKVDGAVDATDMEAVDPIISKLREASAKMGNGDTNGASCGVDGVCI
ncbi:hypothetical protein EG328_010383 [Venturia inaequalis]|uniref:Nucleotide exchange factor Fes1 domain-containing protein n=1 Tax=Venturia inaequalis TaxID=5025 RepID=A0A8H3V9D2_VENIN|nr:hypothetical protein EG328_010383 [Venturia inaequalis]RDI87827.1 hypothetical protein Vi05172_g2451 [Venturia inaequalis]